jgi:DDB1- and CUL4-associated factor 13
MIVHDLSTRKHLVSFPNAHKGMLSGLCFTGEQGDRILSCGVDKTVKLWDVRTVSDGDGDAEDAETRSEVSASIILMPFDTLMMLRSSLEKTDNDLPRENAFQVGMTTT